MITCWNDTDATERWRQFQKLEENDTCLIRETDITAVTHQQGRHQRRPCLRFSAMEFRLTYLKLQNFTDQWLNIYQLFCDNNVENYYMFRK